MNIKRLFILVGTVFLGMTLVLMPLLFLSGPSDSAQAAGPWYVAPDGNDSNSCQSIAAPCATINGAIGKATGGDTIFVATGTYSGTGAEVVLIYKDITLSGGWDATFTTQVGKSTIDGEHLRRGVSLNGVTATVEQFTVQNGYAPGTSYPSSGGGGIWIYDSALTFNDSTVNNCTANIGGGIFIRGTLIANNVVITGNHARGGGGGIYDGVNNTPNSEMILNNSVVSGNTSENDGGGIFIIWAVSTLNNSTVNNNVAYGYGGGIYNRSGILSLDNSTISGNKATEEGGGIHIRIDDSNVSINSSTIYGNIAMAGDGGGVSSLAGVVTLQNTILADNLNPQGVSDCSGTLDSWGYNLISDDSGCTFNQTTGDLINIDANLGELIGLPGYHHLMSGSPAIDAGNPSGCTDHSGNPLTSDQRGAARVGVCDIGSYEYTVPGTATSVIVATGSSQRTPPNMAFEIPLKVWVLDSIGSPVSGKLVTFTAPASGASGTFADSGTRSTTLTTNVSGAAPASTFTANGMSGSYSVTAGIDSGAIQTSIALTNVGWYVTQSGNDTNDCQTPGTACATINNVLGKPTFVNGDTVLVATGVYTGAGDEVVLLDRNVMLLGGWDNSFMTQNGSSIIDGENTRKGIRVAYEKTASIEQFTIQNGFSNPGGLDNEGTLTIENVIIQKNHATGAGGISNSGTITINNSTITQNETSGYVGGLYNMGVTVLNNSIVSNNIGTGIYNYLGTLTLNNSIVRDNIGGGDGGGIHTSGTMIVYNSAIYNNVANEGAGINVSTADGTSVVNNSTVSNNTSIGDGGGVFGSITFNSSTITGNTANRGGGIFGTATLQNTILADNNSYVSNGSDCNGTIGTLGYNLIGSTSGCTFSPGTGDLINVNADIGQLIGSPGYHPLLAGSPAVDAGNPVACSDHLWNPLDTDQRGAPRVGRCDIGAYEYTTPGPAHTILAYAGTPQRTPPLFDFNLPLQAVVMDDIGSPVDNITVTFSAPTSGASGIFINSGAPSISEKTLGNGIATAGIFTANNTSGTYTVTAQATGILTPTSFNMTNIGWYVTTGGDDGNNCQTSSTACATINGVLDHPEFMNGDTALVTDGTYYGTGDEVVLLNYHVTLLGGWDTTFTTQDGTTIIDGGSSRRGIAVDPQVNAILNNFTIQNAYVDNSDPEEKGGGGIYNAGNLTLNECVVQNNNTEVEEGGGGIYNAGNLTLNECVIQNNNADFFGGGVANASGHKLLVNDSAITNNTSRGGGGIKSNGTTNINNTTISGNETNLYPYWGGGILVENGVTMLNNCTVSENSAEQGGGIYNSHHTNTVLLKNTILADNQVPTNDGPDCLGDINSHGYNLVGDTVGCTFSASTGDLLNTDPRLLPLAGYYALLPSSPAIDAGNPSGCTDHAGNPLTTDQRGTARPLDGDGDSTPICDIGSYEFDPDNPTGEIFMPLVTRNYCPPLFADDFSDPSSGWPSGDDGNVHNEYLNDEYRILVRNTYWWAATRPGFQASDYILAVDVRNNSESWIGCGSYGLLFGLSEDWSQFYTFEIDRNENYGIFHYSSGTWTTLAEGTSGSINTGFATNRLKIKREGALIEAYANGEPLASISDVSYIGMRYVGLIVASSCNGNVDARFDNFAVYPVTCNFTADQNVAASRAPDIELPETGQIFSQPHNRKR